MLNNKIIPTLFPNKKLYKLVKVILIILPKNTNE